MPGSDGVHQLFLQFFVDSDLATCKLTGCNVTIFPGLEKHTDDIKDARQRLATRCLIKTDDPQHVYQYVPQDYFQGLWHGL